MAERFQWMAWLVLGAVPAAVLLRKAWSRVLLSRAKHPSLAGHPRWARRLARWLPGYEFDAHEMFGADGAPAEVGQQRRVGFDRLAAIFGERFAATRATTAGLQGALADVEFTSRYRVPFQFSRQVQERLSAGSMLRRSSGRKLMDLDGNELYDLTGSYGVNLFGYGFYRGCIERGAALVSDLGPVLGALHPVVEYNVKRLREISKLDAVSFHMSGTEAVMQAVRLARYHTGRARLVRFCGAYHGWWGEVQPGVGNPHAETDTFTLSDMSRLALRVLETRSDIACVLVNPLQALHPNAGAPADSALVAGTRETRADTDGYRAWLRQLREVCTRRNIVLIFDEVMMGFRCGAGGAQALYGVSADLVTYGKSLGGGLPVGVLCGRATLMRRYRDDHPADICFARGTFNANPYVMGAMHEFLRHVEDLAVQRQLAGADALWNERAASLNSQLEESGLPLRVASLGSVWTMCFTSPSRYHWMLQYYLRVEGLALSWVGTGRLIFSLDYTPREFEEVCQRILAAARRMNNDGWWWAPPADAGKLLRRRVWREMVQAGWRAWLGSTSSPLSRWRGER
jgi:glutamate-1-semialdehyde 2,1-aminomutase